MIERLLHLGDAALEQAEIDHHAGRGSGVPRTVTSARNEWPWISSLAAPKVVPDSACAASKRNDFVNSHIVESPDPI